MEQLLNKQIAITFDGHTVIGVLVTMMSLPAGYVRCILHNKQEVLCRLEQITVVRKPLFTGMEIIM